jgi:tRNA-intron endonuclease, archaea type
MFSLNKMIQAIFSQDKIYSTSPGAFSLYEKSRFGEKKQNKILYSPVEALFLLQENKLQLISNSRPLSQEKALKKLKSKDKKIELKLAVYEDLRKKGYILKTALKFGADFRVYEKGVKPSQDHARWILAIVKESDTLDYKDFASKNRVAHSTKKKLLLAIVDEESDVSYYEVSWLKP